MTRQRLGWGLLLGTLVLLAAAGPLLRPSPDPDSEALTFFHARAELLAPILYEESWSPSFTNDFIQDWRTTIGQPSDADLLALYELATQPLSDARWHLAALILRDFGPQKLSATASLEGRRSLPTSGNPPRQGLHISEFLAVPNTHGAGEWVELHNSSTKPINLAGWSLINDPGIPRKHVFSSQLLAPDAYLAVDNLPFELPAKGACLGLFDPEGKLSAATAWYPAYPAQLPGVSYGVATGEDFSRYFSVPTPGAANTPNNAFLGISPPLAFSHASGHYAAPLELSLTTDSPDATIRYTLDGSPPSADHGTHYSAPIPLSTTTIVRATAVTPEHLPAPEASRSYLFTDVIPSQSAQADLPETWGDGEPALYTFGALKDHYKAELPAALRALPSLSIALPAASLWDPETGLYMNSLADGRDWEREARMEFIPNGPGEQGFSLTCGLRIQGRSSRQPETTPKHSFRVEFRGEYGDATLRANLFQEPGPDRFNTVVLRATSNHSWLYPRSEQREKAQYLRDVWAKDTQRAMGHAAPRCRYVHLYLNGMYWGLYVISERPDEDFMAGYFGGDPDGYEVRKGAEVVAGDDKAWQELIRISRETMTEEHYARVGELVDLDNFIDYLILNHYAGNDNWDFGNWYTARPRDGSHGFRFFAWDAESIFMRLEDNKVFTFHRDRGTELFQALRKWPPFQERFRGRMTRHLTGEGALTPAAATARYRIRAQEIDQAIIAESARWGTYRRDVQPYRTEPFEAYTREEHWLREQAWLREVYFPSRTEIVLDQYASAGF